MPEVKKRRVLKRDQDHIATFINDIYATRRDSKERKMHLEIWKEVDRQVKMQAPKSMNESGNADEDWTAALQLGDLADASETLTADAMRLLFPIDRRWFHPHVELEEEMPEREFQRSADNLLRNLMAQQMKDFGFRGRMKLAVKEILHHGSVVATVEKQTMAKFHDGSRKETLTAPVWVTHSMHRSYPDPSPSIQGAEMFYQGSMIIESWIPLSKAKKVKPWINRDKLTESKEFKGHIHLLTYYGDIFIPRQDGDIWVPNRKAVISDGVFLFSEVNETSYLPVIYTGYERDDVTDPYYTSPLVKMAPMGKFVTEMTNKTMDAVDLKVKPPTQWDGLDLHLIANGGPLLAPGAHNKTRGGKGIAMIDIGTETASTGLAAVQWGKQEMAKGVSVDPTRAGVTASTEQTATEVVKTEQRAEVREVEFVGSLETHGVLPYLYMHHDLNKQHLESYPFFNDDLRTKDFVRASKKDLPKAVMFEIVGSRSLLGEEQRTARFVNAATFVATIPPLAAKTDWSEVGQQIWEDTRIKDPARFIVEQDDDKIPREQFEQAAQQAQQITQQLQQQLQETAQRLQKAEVQVEVDKAEKARLQASMKALEERNRIQSQMESAKDELLGLQKTIENQQEKEDVIALRQRLTEQAGRLDRALTQLETAKVRNASLQADINALQKEAHLDGQMDKARKELQDAKCQLQESEAQGDADGDAIKQAVADAEKAIEEISREIEQDRKQRETTRSKVLNFISRNGSDEMRNLAEDLK